MSVIQYLWECQVEIVIDGGWNSVLTLKTLVEFYENVVSEPRKLKRVKHISSLGENILLNCACYEINLAPIA